jgi:ActR/RegA family two-component response regulator
MLFDKNQTYRFQKAYHVRIFELEYVRWLLALHGGNISAAARSAKMDRKHLSDLKRKHGIR